MKWRTRPVSWVIRANILDSLLPSRGLDKTGLCNINVWIEFLSINYRDRVLRSWSARVNVAGREQIKPWFIVNHAYENFFLAEGPFNDHCRLTSKLNEKMGTRRIAECRAMILCVMPLEPNINWFYFHHSALAVEKCNKRISFLDIQIREFLCIPKKKDE